MTLPDLQAELDQLVPGAALHLELSEVERLFGVNDVAAGRLRAFAAGHDCIFTWSPSGVEFLRRLAPRVGLSS